MASESDADTARRRTLASWGLLVAPELGLVLLALVFVLAFALF